MTTYGLLGSLLEERFPDGADFRQAAVYAHLYFVHYLLETVHFLDDLVSELVRNRGAAASS